MTTGVSMLDVLSHAALKGAAVLAVALVAGVLLPKMAAARRYAVWITAVGALALLPPAMLLLPAWHVLPQARAAAVEWTEPESAEITESQEPASFLAESKTASGEAPETPLMAAATPQPPPSQTISWHDIVPLLPFIWLTISALLLLRLVLGAVRLRRLEHTLPAGSCGLLAEASREIGLKRAPQLLVGAEHAVPMVWGVWHPRLVLPLGFDTWSQEKLRGVLLHELAHLKRRDPLALWAAQWVKVLHWFNPLAWLTFHQLRADQERACDDTVLRHGVRPSDYAQHLLDLSRHARLAPGLALCALTITRCAPVEGRVKAILDPRRSREGLTLRWLLGMAGLALLTTLPVAMLHAIEGSGLRGRLLDRNGVVLAETTEEKMRHYPLRALTGHVTGYTRLPDEKHPQIYGGAALEATHDAILSTGKDLDLSIDARIQALTLRTMQDAGYKRGAAVVLDPRTGEILASVSLPLYDPNVMVPAISQKDWDVLLKDKDSPLLDRCSGGRFAPGAAFMPLTALAGISKGVGHEKFHCTGSVTYGGKAFQCWRQRAFEQGHGLLGMTDAIFNSCNCYWYQLGNKAGADSIAKVGRLVGFGEDFGIIGEGVSGTLPTPEWLASHRPEERWSLGHTANLAIGQGMLTTTPLHMAVLAATVAQSGRVPQPTFLRIKNPADAKARAGLTGEGLAADRMEELREGMRQVVNKDGGTGKMARSDKVVIAGKTGTAQAWRTVAGEKVEDNNTWFIGFAPYDNPTLAFAILKQGGKSGGHDCAPLAKRIVEEALALPADGSGNVVPVDPPPSDTAGVEIKDEIQRQAAAMGGNFKLNELMAEDGKIVLTGDAQSINQALGFFDRLRKLGEQRNIEWQVPVPAVQEDKRARFRAVGTYQPQPAAQKADHVEKNGKANAGTTDRKPEAPRRDAISAAVDQIQKAIGAGLVIKTRQIEDQSVTLRGEAASLNQAMQLRDKLMKLEDEFRLKWRFPLSEPVAGDGKKVTFWAIATPRSDEKTPDEALKESLKHASKDVQESFKKAGDLWTLRAKIKDLEAGKSPNHAVIDDLKKSEQTLAAQWQATQVPPKAVPANQMAPADMEKWKVVQKAGPLADLPEKAMAHVPAAKAPPFGGTTTGTSFWFSAPREDVHHWLMASLSEKTKQMHSKIMPWPDAPQSFHRAYFAASECWITLHSLDGTTVVVQVTWRKRPLLIAPPTPKTAAPKELEGVVGVEDPMPWQDSLYREQVPLAEWGKRPSLPLFALSAPPSLQEKEMMREAMTQRDSSNDVTLLVATPE